MNREKRHLIRPLVTILFMATALFLSFNSCIPSKVPESPGTILSLSQLPDSLHDSTNSVHIIVNYGDKSEILYQGKKGDSDFLGPYQVNVKDYQDEDLVYEIYQYNAGGVLLKADSITYDVGKKVIIHVITVKESGHGSVSPEGDTIVNHKDSLEITAMPEEHYHFVNWTVEGNLTLDENTSPSTVVREVAHNGILTAHFALDAFNITTGVSGSGTVSPMGETTVDYNGSLAIKAVPDSNHRFTGWSVEGDLILADTESDSTQVLNVKEPGTVTANFEKNTYSVVFIAGPNGQIGDQDTVRQTITHGEDCAPVGANPSSGYQFTDWSGDRSTSLNPLTVTNVTSDLILTAGFSNNTYKVTFKAGAKGKIRNNESEVTENVPHGGNSTVIQALPDPGYQFTGWSGSITSADNPLTLINVSSEATVMANFEIIKFTVKFIAGENGQIGYQDTAVQTIDYGGDCGPVEAIPAPGYVFTSWSGGRSTSANPLTVTNVTSDLTLTASFSDKAYKVTFVAGENGKVGTVSTELVSGLSEIIENVPHGGNSTVIEALPEPGYKFVGWTGEDISTADNPLTLTNVGSEVTVMANFEIIKFKVKFIAGENGQIGDQDSVVYTIDYASDCPLVEAIPASGYVFTSWSGDRSTSVNPLTVTNVTSDLTLTAGFSDKAYKVTFVAGENGKVGAGQTQVTQNVAHGGNSSEVAAVPAPGYKFVDWTGGISSVDNPLTLSNVKSDITVTANFEPGVHTVRFIAGANGTVGGEAEITQTVEHGQDCNPVEAVPSTGYQFAGWTGVATPTMQTLIITNVTKGMEVTANFTLKTYTLSVTCGTGGTVSKDPDEENYGHGTTVTLEASPNTGYNFAGWEGDASGTANPTSIIMDADKSVTATFIEIPTYDLTMSVTGQGTVSPGSGTHNEGSSVELTATPAAGWAFDGWSGDVSGTTNPVTITMDANKSVTATFSQITYNLTMAVTGHGTVSPGNGTHNSGSTVSISATPASGWQFDGWSGDESGTTNPMDIIMDADKSVTAAFSEIPTYDLTTSVIGQGTVSPSSGTYEEGSSVELTATPAAGYAFDSWSGDASGTTSPVSITMDGDKSVTATFIQVPTYDLSTSVNGQGSINPSSGTFEEGSSVELTASPAANWQFDGWSDDASGTANPTSITMDANKSVTANFSQITYTLTMTANGEGTVSPGSGTYTQGDDVTIKATPGPGMQFDGWSGDVSGITNPTIIIMNADKSITATFIEITE